ncbi:alpha-2-macroglobulin family protein [Roseateles sp. P5_E7]
MPHAPSALFRLARTIAVCVLSAASAFVNATEPTARVLTFSPQGSVPAAQQVRATFSEPMLPLGKLSTPGPFEVDCALAGDAHWVDDRTWVMDLKDQALSGQACEFRLKPALKSLAGRAVGGTQAFRFKLPVLTEEMRRTVRSVYPGRGSRWVAEDQAFLLTYSSPLGNAQPDLRCEAPGHAEAPAVHLPAAMRDELIKQVIWLRGTEDRTEAVRCPFAFAPESAVTLRLVRPGLKADVMNFQVRPLPAMTVNCRRLVPDGDCVANFPVILSFNAALPEPVLAAIRLEGARGPLAGSVNVHGNNLLSAASSAVSFAGELEPQTEYRIRWPEQALVDVSGRPLSRDRLPASVRTAPAPALAYFPMPSLAIRPLQADNSVPVFLHGAADGVTVREKFLADGGSEQLSDQDLLRWMGMPVPGGAAGTSHFFWWSGSGGAVWRTRDKSDKPLLPADAAALPLEILVPGTAPASRRSQVLLRGAGLHLLELQAFAGQGAAGPVHDSVAVLLTRLAVHLKVAAEDSAVWVTALDGGAPVAGVALKVYDCAGRLAWQGVSGKDGLAGIDRRSLGSCSESPDAGTTVVARYTWPDGERDLSVANSHWESVLDVGSQGVRWGWGAAEIRAHTVLDRSLFKPGETVAMRHVVRAENDVGLAPPDANELPATAEIRHAGSGKAWTVPVTWALPGDGGSSFQLPKDAPLGRYSVKLQVGRDGARSYSTPFAVEAFRLPAMLGAIEAPGASLLPGTAPTLRLALHYADGGAAQRWPVTLRVHAKATGYRRPAALAGYPSRKVFADASRDQAEDEDFEKLLLDAQPLELDVQGRAQLTLPALPVRAQPYLLHAELSYADPNGEVQTLSQDFDVQPSRWTAGVRTLGGAGAGRRVMVQSLLVDGSGARQAAQPVRISARRGVGYGSAEVEDLGEVCTGMTDANGLLACNFVLAKAGHYQFEVTARDPDGRVAVAYGQAFAGDRAGPAQPLFLTADKPLYREGETAKIAISGPFPRARAWLTLERQGILESRVVMLDAAQTSLRLPIRREWAGNVAVSLLALDAGAGASPGAVAAGITELTVSTEARALRVSLTPDRRRYQPGERASVRVRVTTPDGRPLPAPSRLSFFAVDEALLSLKDNPSWQLLAHMRPPRVHGVHTTSGQVMNPALDAAGLLNPALAALMEHIRKANETGTLASSMARKVMASAMQRVEASDIGQFPDSVVVTGSKVIERDDAAPPPPRTLLDSLLYWQADVPLDDRGRAVVSFPIKDSLSRFRLVAVVSAGAEDFGTGIATLDVGKDLQITAGLPPQVREGDRFTALVTVRNTSGNAITLDATARLADQAELPAQALRLAAGESRQLSWEVGVPTGAKALSWTFAAKERGGPGRQDVLAATQQVEPAVPVTVQAATLAQVTGSFDVPAFGFDSAGASGARVAVQLLPSLAGNLGGVQAWLAAYPYRCLEQTASRAIGMHDRAAWDAAMAELPRYLDDDGLANYFPRTPSQPRQGSDTQTSYLLDVASTSGWPIPDAERSRMLAALERFVAGSLKRSFWSPRDDGLARKLAAMATLARHGRLKAAQLAAIRVDPDEWTTAMLTDWLTILRKTGFPPGTQATQAMTENALRARLSYQGRRIAFSTEHRDYWWWLMSNGDVDAARLLLAVADLPGWKADLPRLLTGLLARQQKHGAWATTNANAWGTLAVDAFARLMEPVPVAGETHITLGKREQTVNWGSAGSRTFDAGLDEAGDALRIRHTGGGAPWASVEVRAAVPLTAPRFAGYSVSRSIMPVQQKTPGQWHVGDILRVRLSVRAQADMTWVVVNDPVPAGASLLGTGLGRDSAAAQAGEQRSGNAWPLYQARDFTSFKSFYRRVPRGDFTLEYTIRLNNPGQFVLPPTRVEAMYAPEVFGETPNAVFAIEP